MSEAEEDGAEAQEGGGVVLGAILCVWAAFVMACSMTLQRYALAYPEDTVPLCCWCGRKPPRLKRMRLWMLGLVVYGIANGFYTVGLNFAPLSMCGAIFATVLVFNLFFAKLALGEELSKAKILGCVLVLAGVVVCALSAPTVAGQFNANDIEAFAAAPTGWCYFVSLNGILLFMMVKCFRFEKQFPFEAPGEEAGEEAVASPSIDNEEYAKTFKVLAFIYPCSLGIQEGLCQLGLKGWVTMLFSVFGGSNDLAHPAFWYDTAVTVFFCVLALRWLELVYRRCETSQALPIEYGTVTAVAVCSGILFFQEYKLMDGAQLAVMIGGVFVMSLGIAFCSSGGPSAAESAEQFQEERRRSQQTVPVQEEGRRSSLQYIARGSQVQRRPSKEQEPGAIPSSPDKSNGSPAPPAVEISDSEQNTKDAQSMASSLTAKGTKDQNAANGNKSDEQFWFDLEMDLQTLAELSAPERAGSFYECMRSMHKKKKQAPALRLCASASPTPPPGSPARLHI